MDLKDIVHYLSTARSEFKSLTPSVYGRFVVPFYLEKNNLSRITHSVAVEGGRGCGKTMYLRYFSHWTQFDKQRTDVKSEDIETIILYWRPDTLYSRAVTKSWLTEENARSFFCTLTALELFSEFISSLENVAHHFPTVLKELHPKSEFWMILSEVVSGTDTIEATKSWINKEIFAVRTSINSNDVRNLKRLEPKALFDLLLPALRKSSSTLSKTKFKIFVDEFENLSVYQQKIINSYRKASDASLSWNVAHKQFANVSTETESEQQLQQPDDYRTISLDEELPKEYDILASEIFILTLQEAGLSCAIEQLNPSHLGDPKYTSSRRDGVYQARLRDIMERIFPTPSEKELAKIAMDSPAARKQVTEKLLGLPQVTPDLVEKTMEEAPDVAVTTWCVSNQRSFESRDYIQYMQAGRTGKAYTEKVQHFRYGALLTLNLREAYVDIPVYAGFDRFVIMAKGSIRHFNELCYQSIRLQESEREISVQNIESFPPLSAKHMHNGAKVASAYIVEEIVSFTPNGKTLFSIVKRFGDLFQMAQRSLYQSEPERNHFFVDHDFGKLPEKIDELIRQAKCWRVLIQHGTTKDKDPDRIASTEYVLNPIFSPNFGISYRKKRRIDLTVHELETIFFGESEQYEKLRSRYIASWKSDLDEKQGKLL